MGLASCSQEPAASQESQACQVLCHPVPVARQFPFPRNLHARRHEIQLVPDNLIARRRQANASLGYQDHQHFHVIVRYSLSFLRPSLVQISPFPAIVICDSPSSCTATRGVVGHELAPLSAVILVVQLTVSSSSTVTIITTTITTNRPSSTAQTLSRAAS